MTLIFEKRLNKPIGTTMMRIFNGSVSSICFDGKGCQFPYANVIIFNNILYIYHYMNKYEIKGNVISFCFDNYFSLRLPNDNIEDFDFYNLIHTACSMYTMGLYFVKIE